MLYGITPEIQETKEAVKKISFSLAVIAKTLLIQESEKTKSEERTEQIKIEISKLEKIINDPNSKL